MTYRTILASFLFAPLLSLIFLSAQPQTACAELGLDQAKASGVVGEQSNGYLAAVSNSPSGEVKSLVNSINEKRKAKYQSIAERRGTSLKAVEALAGKTAIEKTSPGQFVNSGSGWQRK